MVSRIPERVNRIIVHQYDPARPSPGGIDTCLRGICRYAPADQKLAFVGVDTGQGKADRKLGIWEKHAFGDREVWFLPVARLDPGDQKRRIPHSLKLLAGLLRFKNRLPGADYLQAHRMDIGLALGAFFRMPLVYYIHTQENGLTGQTSDSFWRYAAGVHKFFEKRVVRSSNEVVVFNEGYASKVSTWSNKARFSPTWFDPRLIKSSTARDQSQICWVGRLEVPKDPKLALEAFVSLVAAQPETDWKLQILGSGTLQGELEQYISRMLPDIRRRIHLRGRVAPDQVASIMGQSGTFLMTSHAGYEGYPRVLVEALASGLPAVVTDGSDTGGLVETGITGYVCGREPAEMAERILDAQSLDREHISARVEKLSAPVVVGKLFEMALSK